VRIEAIKIEGRHALSQTALTPEDVVKLVRSENFTWIDIDISHTTEQALKDLLVGKLDFHPATAWDCYQPSPYHQPKMDEEQNYKFITFLYYEQAAGGELTVREINMYVSETYVISVHRHPCPEYQAAFKRMPRHITEYQARAILFLHHMLDVIIESFTPILRSIQQRSDELEIAVLRGQRRHMITMAPFKRHDEELTDMKQILRSRQALVMLRRTLNGEVAIVNQLINEYDYENAPEESEEIAIYFRDVADHIGKYLEIIEGEDRTTNHLMEIHTLITGHRTNEIVYVLTLISTIMLPLNLVVGFWGMNFEDLWFIRHEHGIWLVVLLMVAITVSLAVFFRSKDWI
jgi:magnesium transporter